MKKLFTLIAISLCFYQAQLLNAQCTVVATANPYIICAGDSAQLLTSTTVLGTYYTFDFNDSILPPGWAVTGGATFSVLPACAAPTLDNSPFYWSSTSGVTPEMQTTDLDVSSGGTINYEFRYKGNSSSSPCETADQYNEGVRLDYSTDGGMSWNLVVYMCSVPAGGPWDFVGGYPQTLLTMPVSTTPGNGNGSTGIYDNWAPYVIPIPLAAQTTSTRFRWRQPNSSGPCCDNWGLDNINIAAQPNLFFLWENGLSGFGASTQTLYNIGNDTCITVIVNDTTSGYICLDTVCITTDQLPNLLLSYSNPYCVGELVTLDGSLSDPSISSYNWDLDFNGTFEVSTGSPTYPAVGSFTTAGNYNITFQGITPGGCVNSMDTVVEVYNNPNLNLSVTDPTVCIYDTADFSAVAFLFNAAGQSSTITDYAWDFNADAVTDASGATLNNVSHFFPGLGTYPVTVTVTSSAGCDSSRTINVTYVDVPHGNIVAPTICANEQASFSFNTIGTPAVTTYHWDFGNSAATNDTSVIAAPFYQYPSNGNYVVFVVVGSADACLDTMATTIFVDPLPSGLITNVAVCEDHDENFMFTQTSTDSIVSYAWNFPGGSPLTSSDQIPVVNFASSGTINTSVIITNQYGCIDTVFQPFIVRAQPVAGIGIYPICISRFTFDPLVAPDDNSVVIDWNLGDGTTLPGMDTSIFNYIYQAPGDYTVSLVITDQYGCADSTTTVVSVNDSLFVEMPNVLIQNSSLENDKIDMENVLPGFNLCINWTYTVFDRWGVQVYETSNDPYNPDLYCDKCFRGNDTGGAELVPGVYYYVMKGNFSILKAGFITIFE